MVARGGTVRCVVRPDRCVCPARAMDAMRSPLGVPAVALLLANSVNAHPEARHERFRPAKHGRVRRRRVSDAKAAILDSQMETRRCRATSPSQSSSIARRREGWKAPTPRCARTIRTCRAAGQTRGGSSRRQRREVGSKRARALRRRRTCEAPRPLPAWTPWCGSKLLDGSEPRGGRQTQAVGRIVASRRRCLRTPHTPTITRLCVCDGRQCAGSQPGTSDPDPHREGYRTGAHIFRRFAFLDGKLAGEGGGRGGWERGFFEWLQLQ